MPERLRVDQFVPVLLPQDAVGNHTLATQRALEEAGIEAGIWAIAIHPELSRRARPYTEFARAAGRRDSHRLLLYQAASVSGDLAEFLLGRREPKVISYHNLTPARYYAPYDGGAANGLRQAADEVRRLSAQARAGIAASEFNAADLRAWGVPAVHVIPPYLGRGLSAEPDRVTLAALDAGRRGLELLFVGRLVPNKGHHHLIRLMSALRAGANPEARLFLVGPPGPDPYMRALERLAGRLAPGGVIFTGPVSDAELAAHYRHADVFVCMSEHEGFGIPLVEAMRAGLPVVALDAGAVAETLGGTGVLVRTADPRLVAEVVARTAGDASLRAELTRRQAARAAELEAFPRDARLVEVLRDVAG